MWRSLGRWLLRRKVPFVLFSFSLASSLSAEVWVGPTRLSPIAELGGLTITIENRGNDIEHIQVRILEQAGSDAQNLMKTNAAAVRPSQLRLPPRSVASVRVELSGRATKRCFRVLVDIAPSGSAIQLGQENGIAFIATRHSIPLCT